MTEGIPSLRPASGYPSKTATLFILSSGAHSNSEGLHNSTEEGIEYYLRISTSSSSRILERGPSSSNDQKHLCLKGAIGTASLSASRTSPQAMKRDPRKDDEATNKRSWESRKTRVIIHSSRLETQGSEVSWACYHPSRYIYAGFVLHHRTRKGKMTFLKYSKNHLCGSSAVKKGKLEPHKGKGIFIK